MYKGSDFYTCLPKPVKKNPYKDSWMACHGKYKKAELIMGIFLGVGRFGGKRGSLLLIDLIHLR